MPRHGNQISRLQQLSPSPLSPMSSRRPSLNSPGDRFIPNRSAMDLDIAHFNLMHETKENPFPASEIASPVKEEYRRMLAENLLYDVGPTHSPKILAFKKKSSFAVTGNEQFHEPEVASPRKQFRQIAQTPDKVLDAPDIVDDYYLNLLDWSCTNFVAVALGPAVYLWDAETCNTHQLMRTESDDEVVTSVAWAEDGRHIAVGLNNNEIQIWDANLLRQVRTLGGHSARVSSLAWNCPILSSGGRDNLVLNHDVRARNARTVRLMGHSQEVCGLKWSPSGQQLASGGNDNLLHIWDVAVASSFDSIHPHHNYVYRFEEHQAAVKALAWCPFQSHLLASGGGTADRCIKFWNTQTGVCLNSIDTASQVCALLWSEHHREIISSHGYSHNQLCVWKYPSMAKVAELRGHVARVLHLAQSPDGVTVASAAADETLRFWRVFGSPSSNKKESSIRTGGLSSSFKNLYIR